MLNTRRPGGMQPSTQIALAWNVAVDGERNSLEKWQCRWIQKLHRLRSQSAHRRGGAGQRPDCRRRR